MEKMNFEMSLAIENELSIVEMEEIQAGSIAVIIGCGCLAGAAEIAAVSLTWGLGAASGELTFAGCMLLN